MRTITDTWSKIVADGTEQMGCTGIIRKGLKQVEPWNSLDMRDYEIKGIKVMTPRICLWDWVNCGVTSFKKKWTQRSLINIDMTDNSPIQKFYKKVWHFYFPNFKLLSVMLNQNKLTCLQRNCLKIRSSK